MATQAGVTVRDNTLNGSAWNEWATLLNAAIFDADAQQNKYDDLLNALAIVDNSDRWAEKATTFGGLGDFEFKAEGADSVNDEAIEGYSKLMEHFTFTKQATISKELRDDNQIADAKQKVINMVQAYKRSRAKYLSQAIVTSVGSTKTMSFGGKTGIDISAADTMALFNAAHPLKNCYTTVGTTATQVTQSNLYSNALDTDPTMLNRLSNIMRNFKDDRGEVLGFDADIIVIPGNQPALERYAKAIIGSDGEVGSNKNDINTERGKWKLIVDYLWTPATGSPYILMSSEGLKATMGTRFWNRTVLDIENEEKVESRNLVYNGFARWSCGFPNWRHVLMGGSSDASATTLS